MPELGLSGPAAYSEYVSKEDMLALVRANISNPRVIEAMSKVPRECFVPPGLRSLAYADVALPIGQGQTISQPLLVAMMTELLAPKPQDRVLEIGTGSGYQAAVLAEMCSRVVTVEIVPKLAEKARETLEELGYGDRVEVHLAPGELGCPAGAPYDGIMVTAAAPKIPGSLLRQLAPGGAIVLPVGLRYGQTLMRAVKLNGDVRIARHGWCTFVLLLGSDGWGDSDA